MFFKNKHITMLKKITLTVFIFSATFALAHEFWLSPSDFYPKLGEKIKLSVFVDENYEGKRWGGGSRRIEALKIRQADQWLPLAITQSDSLVQIPDYQIVDNGTHVFTLVTNNSFIELEPAKFEVYLKEDGLENVLEYRQKNNESQRNGRELYRRCAKAIVQVGSKTDHTATMRSDLILDIKPTQNPYSLTKNQSLSCQFRYDDQNLKNTLVRCWRRFEGKTEIEFQKTDNRGFATFELPKKGTGVYMVSTVTMVRLTNNPKADWQSTWGSLTFG
jgi:uncharacterized GH25 family protein